MAEAARTELELHPGHQAFLDEILSLLRAGQAPSTRPLGDWTSVLDPRLGSLAGKLAAEAPAFACADRTARLARLRLELRRGRIRQTISQLKGETIRAASDPGQAAEMRQLLTTISELTRELKEIETAASAGAAAAR